MKKLLLSFLLLLALIINQQFIFANENEEKFDEYESKEVKIIVNQLLKKRAVLWNKLFNENESLDKIHDDLNEVVTEPLLTYDIEAFNKIKDDYTNMDKILDVSVNSINNIIIKENKLNLEAEVKWYMEGLEKNYTETIIYNMKLIKVKDRWKISDYSVY